MSEEESASIKLPNTAAKLAKFAELAIVIYGETATCETDGEWVKFTPKAREQG